MSQLLETTQRLLRETDRSFDEIAKATGLSRRWVYMLANDEEDTNFGVISVQKVHDFLIDAERAKAAPPVDQTQAPLG
jgi:hypothetical protein